MHVIKEHCSKVRRCVIRTDTYAHTLQHFLNLFEEAKKDFPDLPADTVKVVHFGGKNYKGTFGIEFPARDNVPEEYSEIENLELTL